MSQSKSLRKSRRFTPGTSPAFIVKMQAVDLLEAKRTPAPVAGLIRPRPAGSCACFPAPGPRPGQ